MEELTKELEHWWHVGPTARGLLFTDPERYTPIVRRLRSILERDSRDIYTDHTLVAEPAGIRAFISLDGRTHLLVNRYICDDKQEYMYVLDESPTVP